jgi:hypothetical protein
VPPALAVAPASLAFAATVGGSAPAAKTLDVTNAGSGTLSFTASDDAPWLTVTPGSGSAPQTLTVGVSPVGLAAGTYNGTVTVTAAGVAGSPKTIPVAFTISAAPTGLVAAYGFDEASGTTVADASGSGNTGTISGATRTVDGRYGGALSFDGVNDRVTVPHAASLALTTGMTLEAWLAPTSLGGWRTALLKERTGGLSYALYASDDAAAPTVYGRASAEVGPTGASPLALTAWTHLGGTYDGTTLRLYVNGVQVATQALSGALAAGTQPLSIGGNGVWGEWFAGRIDEVRVYNRALTAADIQADMGRRITPGT